MSLTLKKVLHFGSFKNSCIATYFHDDANGRYKCSQAYQQHFPLPETCWKTPASKPLPLVVVCWAVLSAAWNSNRKVCQDFHIENTSTRRQHLLCALAHAAVPCWLGCSSCVVHDPLCSSMLHVECFQLRLGDEHSESLENKFFCLLCTKKVAIVDDGMRSLPLLQPVKNIL